MTQAVALGRWISTAGSRPVTPRRVLRKPDLPAAAAVIGVPLPARLRTASDVPAIHRPWCLALAAGLLRVEDGAVSTGPALACWAPADADVLSAWLSGLTACSAAEAGPHPHEQDEAVGDVLVLLRMLQDEHVPTGQALVHTVRAQARNLHDEFGLDSSFSWRADEGTVTRAAARLASFGAVSGNDMLTGGCVITPLGRWAAGRLRTMLAGPGEDLSAAELIAYLAECAEDDRFEHAWDWLDAQQLATDDLDHRVAMARASDHPSAGSLTQTITDHVASAGLGSLSVHQCLQLKVTLKHRSPPIWRTVLMPATATLPTLHRVIQILYGWDGDHLHAFRVRHATYSDPSSNLEEASDETQVRVRDALAAGGGKIVYEYDFGAGWTHEVALQRKLPRDPVAVYPVCTKFSGDSPVEYPEGEIWYSDDAGESDPAEPSPAEPESFDLAAVNGKLAALDGR